VEAGGIEGSTIHTTAECDALVAELQAWTPPRETVEEEAERLDVYRAQMEGRTVTIGPKPE